MLTIKPFGAKAAQFIRTPVWEDAPRTILSGAVRSSKTWAMMPKVLQLCSKDPRVPQGGLKVITGASKETVYDNVLNDLFEIVGSKRYRYNRMTGDLYLLGTHWKVIGAKDEGSEKYIRGKTISAVYADEITTMPESFFRQLLNRLSPPGSRLYGTTNPESPHHYLYTDFISNDKINELGSGLFRTIHFSLDDNPNLTDEYKQSLKQSHSGVFYQRFVEGLWVIAEGVIYRDCWDDLENTFDDNEFPKELFEFYPARYIGVDYGSVNPQVYLDVYDDGRVLWVWKEYYFDSQKENKQKSDAQYADDLEKFVGERKDCQVIIDPSAESFAIECRGRGLVVRDADNAVEDGIRMTASMFTKRCIRVHRTNCPNFLRERGLYCWDPKAAEKQGTEKPIKMVDHTMDVIRYIVRTCIGPYRLFGS